MKTTAYPHRKRRYVATLVALGLAAGAQAGGIPISGMPVPEMANFDQLMVDFMTDNDIKAAVLGIMKDGKIVYQRGFGWKDSGETIPLRHDAVMRVASVTKPFTAAAIQKLYATGQLDPNEFVFDLGQTDGGILNYTPFPALNDARYADIKVQQILSHNSGLPDNQISDPIFREVDIADAFNDADIPTAYPPGRTRTIEWLLGQNLQYAPGDPNNVKYSNIGFMVLGQVIETITGTNHLTYVRNNVIQPIEWLPVEDVVAGRTFENELDPREPYYDSGTWGTNVFDPDGDDVRRPHGGYHHELHFASGAFVINTTVMLKMAEHYFVNVEGSGNDEATTYGRPRNGALPANHRDHGGRLSGVGSWMVQRDDGVNFAVIVNKRLDNDPIFEMRDMIHAEIDGGGFTWPTQEVDGQWADFSEVSAGDGAYESPWSDFTDALSASPAEATVNVKASTSDWTGVINQKIRLRNPQPGVARIGQL